MPTVVAILLAFLLLFLGLIAWTQSKRHTLSNKDQNHFKQHWTKILSERGSNPKGAILDADKLLDKALKLKGYNGSVGEKLKQAKTLFSDLNGTWEAHKKRNQIAHELNITPSTAETDRALRQFRKALNDLGIKL